MEHKDRRYHEGLIRDCCCEKSYNGWRWIVQAYHGPTGLPYSCNECAHYRTLPAAREAIDQYVRHEVS